MGRGDGSFFGGGFGEVLSEVCGDEGVIIII